MADDTTVMRKCSGMINPNSSARNCQISLLISMQARRKFNLQDVSRPSLTSSPKHMQTHALKSTRWQKHLQGCLYYIL